MTFLLVILTVAIILAFEFAGRSRKTQRAKGPELVTDHPASFEVIDRFFHPGHTWATVSNSNKVTVGVDDFSAQMIGDIQRAELPRSGQTIRQGETFAVLHRGSRSLPQVAPVSGKVVAINKRLQRNPGLMNDSPLELGWIAKILPTNLEMDLRNLLKGVAAEGWRESVHAQLVQLTAPSVGTLMQDGGQIIRNLGEYFSDEEWNHLVQQFFPILSSNQFQKKTKN